MSDISVRLRWGGMKAAEKGGEEVERRISLRGEVDSGAATVLICQQRRHIPSLCNLQAENSIRCSNEYGIENGAAGILDRPTQRI